MKPYSFPPIPHLETAHEAPFIEFEQKLLQQRERIEQWFRLSWLETPAPFYASCDLRNAGFKVVPVDTNLFPAGFNNLSIDSEPMCIYALQMTIERYCSNACDIILIAENHTRNLMYLESLCRLRDLISKAGFGVRIANLAIKEVTNIALPSGKSVRLHPLQRKGNKIHVDDFTPCAIVLNNDLSSGHPTILDNIDQHILPSVHLGWQYRTKDQHFEQYEKVTEEFSKLVDIDSWFITTEQMVSSGLDFKTGEGVEKLANCIEKILSKTKQKYELLGITQEPYVVAKANSGTYGMGVMTIKDPEEVLKINRKQRNKMSVGKEGMVINQLLVQEGVPTLEVVGEERAVAEPVVYMIDQCVIGGFYRLHKSRGKDENLNAPGMVFKPLDFNECLNKSQKHKTGEMSRFYLYGIISRLALLAAAREKKAIEKTYMADHDKAQLPEN